MVEIELWEKKFPLCLTVGALDPIMEKCGSLNDLMAFIGIDANGKDSGMEMFQMMHNTAWLLGLLLREGEAARYESDRFHKPSERREVPNEASIFHMLTIKSVADYRSYVMEAIFESLGQNIEAVYDSKNGKAEQG